MKKAAPYIGWLIQLLLSAILSILLWSTIYSDEDIISGKLIMLLTIGPIWFISICISIYPLFLWNPKLKKIYDLIFDFPITAMFKFLWLQTNIFMIVMFVLICLLPVALTILAIPEEWQYKWGIVYVVSIIVLLIYSYKSNWIMKLLDKIFNYGFRDKELLEKTFTKVKPRIISYSMMIIIYVTYNFNIFSNNSFDIDIDLIKEVFVTFIAIDTLIQILMNKDDNRNNK